MYIGTLHEDPQETFMEVLKDKKKFRSIDSTTTKGFSQRECPRGLKCRRFTSHHLQFHSRGGQRLAFSKRASTPGTVIPGLLYQRSKCTELWMLV